MSAKYFELTISALVLFCCQCSGKGNDEGAPGPELPEAQQQSRIELEAGHEGTFSVTFPTCEGLVPFAAIEKKGAEPGNAKLLETEVQGSAPCDLVVHVPPLESGEYRFGVVLHRGDYKPVHSREGILWLKPSSTAPAQEGNEEWKEEPAAEVDCNGEPCMERIEKFAARSLLSIGLELGQEQGKLFLHPSAENARAGTFEIKSSHPEFVDLPFMKGEFEVRNGHLALRDESHSKFLYFKWSAFNERQSILFASFKASDGRMRTLYVH